MSKIKKSPIAAALEAISVKNSTKGAVYKNVSLMVYTKHRGSSGRPVDFLALLPNGQIITSDREMNSPHFAHYLHRTEGYYPDDVAIHGLRKLGVIDADLVKAHFKWIGKKRDLRAKGKAAYNLEQAQIAGVRLTKTQLKFIQDFSKYY